MISSYASADVGVTVLQWLSASTVVFILVYDEYAHDTLCYTPLLLLWVMTPGHNPHRPHSPTPTLQQTPATTTSTALARPPTEGQEQDLAQEAMSRCRPGHQQRARVSAMPLTVITQQVSGDWAADTGAGALGRHSSRALNSSKDKALGSGENQQNREPDLRKPGHGRECRFL